MTYTLDIITQTGFGSYLLHPHLFQWFGPGAFNQVTETLTLFGPCGYKQEEVSTDLF